MWHALLLATVPDVNGLAALQHCAAEAQGHCTPTPSLSRQHAAPSQPAAAAPAAPPGATEAAVSSPASLPVEIYESAERGELQKVVIWLRKGGQVDALCSKTTPGYMDTSFALLHAAATYKHVEMVRELLMRGASVDLPTRLGVTPLMNAAANGHFSILLLLLQHSANPDLQNTYGHTALMLAALGRHEACVKALLQANANTELVDKQVGTALQWAESSMTIAQLIRQHATPPLPAAAAPAARPEAIESAMSFPASLPLDTLRAAWQGELQTVVKWLRKGGAVDAFASTTTPDGRHCFFGLLHVAATNGHLEMVRELLKRGASVDLPTHLNDTALMAAAAYGHPSIVLVLLQHSANPDLQNIDGATALMAAAGKGHEACVQALLRAKANAELQDDSGATALHWAVAEGHTATAALLRQHASCLSRGFGLSLCAALPHTCPWVVLSVVLGAIGMVAIRRSLIAMPGQHRAARQRWPHRPARHAKAEGPTSTDERIRQHAAPPQPAAAVAARAQQTAAMEAEHARSKRSKKKSKASRTVAAGDKSSEAPAPIAPAPPPTAAAPKPAVSAAARAEAALRAVSAGGVGAEAAPAAAAAEMAAERSAAKAKAATDKANEPGGSGVGRHGGAAGSSAQSVLALADAGDITGRVTVPESTIGGETTCIVCMAHPKSHIAVPCGHLCACGVCAERMQDCPYCRASVQQWVHARVV